MKNVLVGVLCKEITPDLYSRVRNELPFDLLLFTKRGINWGRGRISGLLLRKGHWRQGEMPFPDAVYNQLYTRSSALARRLEGVIGRGKVFNILTRFNKLATYSILADSKFRSLLIPTRPYSEQSLLEWLGSGPVILKPVYGCNGRGVLKLARTGRDYRVLLQSDYDFRTFSRSGELLRWLKKYTGGEDHILQPFLSLASLGGHIFDLRMLVQKDGLGQWQVTATLSRLGFEGYYINNLAWDVRTAEQVLESSPWAISLPQLKAYAVAIAVRMEEAMGHLGDLSVDFGIAAGRPRLIEVNGMPQKQVFGNISARTLERVLWTPLMYARFLASSNLNMEEEELGGYKLPMW